MTIFIQKETLIYVYQLYLYISVYVHEKLKKKIKSIRPTLRYLSTPLYAFKLTQKYLSSTAASANGSQRWWARECLTSSTESVKETLADKSQMLF